MRPNWFVGLPVEAGRWFTKLVADAPAQVRVFHPEDLHITVAFLGAAGEQRAMAAWAHSEALSAAPIEAILAEVKPMGNPRRPSALSVLLDQGRSEASALIEALRAPMIETAGAKPDTREPKPHLTVARPQRRASASDRRKAVAWAEAKRPLGEAVTLTHLALYTWSDDRPARQFRVVASRAL